MPESKSYEEEDTCTEDTCMWVTLHCEYYMLILYCFTTLLPLYADTLLL